MSTASEPCQAESLHVQRQLAAAILPLIYEREGEPMALLRSSIVIPLEEPLLPHLAIVRVTTGKADYAFDCRLVSCDGGAHEWIGSKLRTATYRVEQRKAVTP